jgi:hypothetical protein
MWIDAGATPEVVHIDGEGPVPCPQSIHALFRSGWSVIAVIPGIHTTTTTTVLSFNTENLIVDVVVVE